MANLRNEPTPHFMLLWTDPIWTNPKDMGGSQCDNDSSPNLSFNDLKQKEGSARFSLYETQLLIG